MPSPFEISLGGGGGASAANADGGGAGYGGAAGGQDGGCGGGGSSFVILGATNVSRPALSTRPDDAQVTVTVDPATDGCPTPVVVDKPASLPQRGCGREARVRLPVNLEVLTARVIATVAGAAGEFGQVSVPSKPLSP
jgi:hypothetical protein